MIDKWFTPGAQEEDASAMESSIHEIGTKLPQLSPRADTTHLTIGQILEPIEKRVVGIFKVTGW